MAKEKRLVHSQQGHCPTVIKCEMENGHEYWLIFLARCASIIRVLPGDQVTVALSPYDRLGRITFRNR